MTRNRKLRATRARRAGHLALIMAALLAVACGSKNRDQPPASGGDGTSVTQLAEPPDALTEALMIPLAQAKNFHHIADVHLSDGNTEQAIAAVRRILAVKFPADAPEAQDVTADARARLGKLLVMAGKLDEALAVVDDGIAAARRESFFVANLHTVRGEVLEATAIRLDDSQPDVARERRVQAIEAFSTSNAIHERLLDKLLEEGPQ